MPSLVSILLVDEDPLMRRATALMLAGRGGKVSEVATLDEAIALSQERVFDVAVIDVGAEGPHPDAVFAQLRAAFLPAARVIVCASSSSDVLDAPTHGGSAAVIAKPYVFERLLTAVFGPRRALAHHPHARAGAAPRAIHPSASRHVGRLLPRERAERADRPGPRRDVAATTVAPLRAARARRDRG
jgi:CheY-like chemotaxis protein